MLFLKPTTGFVNLTRGPIDTDKTAIIAPVGKCGVLLGIAEVSLVRDPVFIMDEKDCQQNYYCNSKEDVEYSINPHP